MYKFVVIKHHILYKIVNFAKRKLIKSIINGEISSYVIYFDVCGNKSRV